MPREPDQAQPPRSIGYVEAQLPCVQISPSANIETLHLVFIVADENKRCASGDLVTINAELDVEKWVTTQDRNPCPHKRGPFARTESLLLFTFANDAGIESETGIVNQDLSINISDVHFD